MTEPERKRMLELSSLLANVECVKFLNTERTRLLIKELEELQAKAAGDDELPIKDQS